MNGLRESACILLKINYEGHRSFRFCRAVLSTHSCFLTLVIKSQLTFICRLKYITQMECKIKR
jgi:hypothetical protein